jgi:folate-dependent phosphoribosylglycinamide formyltransferase PurN
VIAPKARSIVASALSARLLEVERALAGASRPMSEPVLRVSDPEEALRELMVQHLPRAKAMHSDRRARVCELLVGLAGETRAKDMRFLDAFNTWFEQTGGAWQADRAWLPVMNAYAEALRATIDDLQNAGTGESCQAESRWRIGRDAAARETSPVSGSRRVLVLAGHWAAAWRITREVGRVDGLTVHTLICNNAGASAIAFGARQAAAALTSGLRGLMALFVATCQGRVHVRRRHLHHETTLRWLKAERFWIGLHAMGVIYREPLFAAFGRGVLNAHIGLLPEYRGRSVMEWSILSGAPTGISVFFMDSGIDTGREIVLRRTFDVGGADGSTAAKTTLFNRDGEMYRAALALLRDGRHSAEPVNEAGRRYFVMSRLLTSAVDELLQSGATDVVWEAHACTSLA